MRNAWLKKLGEKFYAYTHSDAVYMSGGGNLTSKMKEIITALNTHHHQTSEINDFDVTAKKVVSENAAPIEHAVNSQKYGGATGSNYGHVRTAGSVPGANQYVIPFSTQFSAAQQTTLNNANMLYNGIYAVRFTGAATGAPPGLTSGTTYYGTIFTMNYQQTGGVNSTYGVTRILAIPKIGKLYCQFVTSTSAYGDWTDLTATVSGYA
ncbi:MAG: hypothetical protein ACI4A5_08995 [Hominilimicola sp.]